MSDFDDRIAEMSPERLRLLATGLERELADRDTRQAEPIAITGMSCRFPGAPNLRAFWKLLEEGGDAITRVPAERFDVDRYYDPDPEVPGKLYVREGGFVENVFDFDPGFFGIAPREAISMDPQQRLLLELSWEALEDAGQAAELAGRNVGVFVGHSTNDYVRRSLGHEIDAYSGTGSATSIAAGRISYVFGLTGPNFPVDTACSSSLVALHLACQSLRARECDLALAAGVNLILAPEPTIYFCKMRALAPDARCKTFDALANGYVRGEGCGAIVIRRLSDALADGDRIHALIRGSAVNQDGRSTGLTVPNRFAQEALLERALLAGRVSAADIDYIEAHGTGTPLGDPIEVQAIAAVHEGRERPLFVGSVKTNIGHLEAAAGMAGIIKAVLALQNASIPRHLHFHQPNPYIPWHRLPITVPQQLTPWPGNGSKPRLAGVSSFGFSGTNAHVVLEQAPPPRPRQSCFERPLHLLTLSAKDENALATLAGRMAGRLDEDASASLADVCHSANSGRSHFASRLAVLASEPAEARSALLAFSKNASGGTARCATAEVSPAPSVVFLFTGQGSQYVQMGRELYETLPVFRRALDECATVLHPLLPLPLLSLLYPDAGAGSPLDETGYSQPALFALEYSLARVWQSWGVEPSFCLGHSVGELAAACVAGVFSLEDGLRLATERGRLMQALPAGGTMASIRADGERVEALLGELGSGVSIAALNGPASTVISGGGDDVDAVLVETARHGLGSQRLRVSHAFHSALMDPVLEELERFAGAIACSPPRRGLVSGVTGRVVGGADVLTPDYWRRHARQPVRFAEAVRTVDDRGYSIFVEIGPQPVLSALARSCVGDRSQLWVASLQRGAGECRQMLEGLGALYLRGVKVDWHGLEEGYDRRHVSVPTYPFQRSRYVLEAPDLVPERETSFIAPPPRVKEEASRPEDWLYRVDWRVSRHEKGTAEPRVGRWLLFADAGGVAALLARQLEAEGSTCVLVEPGEWAAEDGERWRIRPEDPAHFTRLLALVEEKGPCVGIVHAWSLDIREADLLDEDGLGQAGVLGTASTLHLIQALALQRGPNPPPLWLVTAGVHRIEDGDTVSGLAQTPLWGMARVAAIEYPNLRCTRVDLEPSRGSEPRPSATTSILHSVLCAHDGEDQVAFRGGERYVPRLARVAADTNARPEFDGSSTYLITGGLGGLGPLLAGWMAGHGARHLALVARHEPSEIAAEAIARLREAGVRVTTVQADVADPDQVAQMLRQLAETMPPLRGVVHAAGVLDDGALLQQQWARFEAVMRPKVAGAWNLHRQTLGLPLDFMVFFSSIASLLGAPGQANYCAANAFLDGLAHHRRARGQTALSINWGPWAEAGMAARQQPAALRAWQMLGIGMLPAAEALASLARLLASPEWQAGVINADWSRLFSLFPSGLEPPFLRDMVKGKRASRPPSAEWTALLKRIERATEEDGARAVQAFVGRLVAEALGRPAGDHVAADTGFFDLGMDSLMTLQLAARLRVALGDGHLLPASFLFNHPTIESVARYLLHAFVRPQATAEASAAPSSQDGEQGIAVVGYACRFPGAATEDGFWDLLSQGKDAIREVPPDRWDVERYYDADPKAPGKMYVRDGGFLEEIDKFDAQFFGISPREAVKMDPQQRLLLETTWRALENARQRPDRLKGTPTGVFVGISGNDYLRALGESADFTDVDAYLATGNALSIAAGRVSHVFGFEGPCLAIDTACSSSLVAVHLACDSLRQGKSAVALAGGVNVILAPEINVSLCKIGALAPDGRCKAFDASANGYVRSEGCGLVVLKRLEDAQRDGDPVLAVILSSSINHDGRSSGVTVPNGTAQVALFREVLAASGLNAGDIAYVEAHGTGTPLGDPIEMNSIAAVYAEGRPADQPLLVGSVKTNIGHLEAAAGVAGLIKVVQSMERGRIPPSVHFRQPSPYIDWQRGPVKIPTRLEEWPNGHRRLAAVSSFGFSGTNAHCIVAAPPAMNGGPPSSSAERSAHALGLSARTEQALREHAGQVAARLEGCGDAELADVFFSLNAGRAHHSQRLFVSAGTVREARTALEALARGDDGGGARLSRGFSAAPPVAYLFTGQGSQYAGMARRLFETQPTFARVIAEGAAALDGALERDLRSVIYPTGGETPIDETLYAQTALFVVQCALVRLWESWGVKPAVVLGHSVGECAAAWAAGIFSFEAGLELVAGRARLLQALPGDGGMLALGCDPATARELLEPHAGRVEVAAVNSLRNTVVSGSRSALATIGEECEGRGIRARTMNVSQALHSGAVSAVADDLLRVARQIEYHEPRVPIVSSVTGDLAPARAMATPEYWARQLLAPVRFSDALRALAAEEQVFLEIGPHPTLVSLGQETLDPTGGAPRSDGGRSLAEAASEHAWLHSLRRGSDDWQEMLGALGALYLRGQEVDWNGFDQDYRRSWVSVPGYPFQRQRFWPERSTRGVATLPTAAGRAAAELTYDDPLLGRRLRSPALAEIVFENRFGGGHPRFLSDHKIYSMLVVPGAAHLAMLAAAAARIGADEPLDLREVTFPEGLILADGEARLVQLILSAEQEGAHRFRVVSAGEDGEPSWIVHSTGTLMGGGREGDGGTSRAEERAASTDGEGVDDIQRRCPDHITNTKMFYRLLAQHGIELGPSFQWIDEIWRRPGEAVARLRLPRPEDHVDAYPIHPGWIDACFQLLTVTLTKVEPDFGTYLPISVGRFTLAARSTSSPWVHVNLRPKTDDDASWLESDIRMLTEGGETIAEIERFRVRRAPRESLSRFAQRRVTDSLYSLHWSPSGPPRSAIPGQLAGSWLVLERSEERGVELASLIDGLGGTCIRVEPGPAFEKCGERLYRIDPAAEHPFRDLLGALALADAALPELKGVIHSWSCGSPEETPDDGTTLLEEQDWGVRSALDLVKALAAWRGPATPRLWLVTSGAQPVGDRAHHIRADHAPMWGLGRVVALEQPRLRCTRLDLDPGRLPRDQAMMILRELTAGDGEDQVGYCGEQRHVARLSRHRVASSASDEDVQVPASAPYRLARPAQGSLSEISAEVASRQAPGRGEVEIHVRASALNFRDVLNALGLYPGNAGGMGWEAAGVVSAVGEGVGHLREGDEVVALAPGSFSRFVTTDARLAVAKPAHLPFSSAAGLPVVFLTAHYCLDRLARLRPGDRILVHAAAGGVGLAAVQLAQRGGAEVFATAGSEEKREYLRKAGVRHVFDSRSLEFAEAVREATGGAGVDVVLNSLAGEYVTKSLSLLADRGRFIEIGKIGTWTPEQMASARPDVEYFVFALDTMVVEETDAVAASLSSLVSRFASGDLEPLPYTTFPVQKARAAFRYMAQARHVGKVVLDHEGAGADGSLSLRDDATYLVTGGLGGLGLHLAQWLIGQGARHLVLVGRRAPDPAAADLIAGLQLRGARVVARRADVSREDDVRDLMAWIEQDMPPLRGVFHAAGVLDDGILVNQDWERFQKVMAPKVLGAVHLDRLTAGCELDFFVMFSSSASLLGFPGQANYAAANSFLDAFAHQRQAQGRPAQSINWGPWDEVGMTVGLRRQWSTLGISAIKVDQGLDTLGVLLREKAPQVAVLPMDWAQIARRLPAGGAPPLIAGLAREFTASLEPTAEWIELGKRVAEAPPAERKQIVVQRLIDMGRAVLGLHGAQSLDTRVPLNQLGFDSLMAVELANELGRSAGKPLAVTLLFDYPTFDALADYLLAEVFHLSPPPPEGLRQEPRPVPPRSAQELVDSISSLTDDDVARMSAPAPPEAPLHR